MRRSAAPSAAPGGRARKSDKVRGRPPACAPTINIPVPPSRVCGRSYLKPPRRDLVGAKSKLLIEVAAHPVGIVRARQTFLQRFNAAGRGMKL